MWRNICPCFHEFQVKFQNLFPKNRSQHTSFRYFGSRCSSSYWTLLQGELILRELGAYLFVWLRLQYIQELHDMPGKSRFSIAWLGTSNSRGNREETGVDVESRNVSHDTSKYMGINSRICIPISAHDLQFDDLVRDFCVFAHRSRWWKLFHVFI
jgi:hypothetical protein